MNDLNVCSSRTATRAPTWRSLVAPFSRTRTERRHRHPLRGRRRPHGLAHRSARQLRCDPLPDRARHLRRLGQADSLDTAVSSGRGRGATRRVPRRQAPVEGTMLTVIREIATAAQGVADSLGLEHLLRRRGGRRVRGRDTRPRSCGPCGRPASSTPAGTAPRAFRGLAAGIEDLMRGGEDPVAGARRRAPRATRSSERFGPRRPHQVTVEEPSELSESRYCTSFLSTRESQRSMVVPSRRSCCR